MADSPFVSTLQNATRRKTELLFACARILSLPRYGEPRRGQVSICHHIHSLKISSYPHINFTNEPNGEQ